MTNTHELDQVLNKQESAYERWKFYRDVGDTALARDEWNMVLHYQKRIEQLTKVEDGQENL